MRATAYPLSAPAPSHHGLTHPGTNLARPPPNPNAAAADAGLLLPFLAAEIYRHPTETPAKQLKGLAVGNGCPGTAGASPAKRGACNGPYGSYDTQHVLELAYGHSALPRPLWQSLQAACGFPCKAATWSEGVYALHGHCMCMLQHAHVEIGRAHV